LPALTALIWVSLDSAAKPIRRGVCLAIGGGGALAAVWAPVMLAQYHRDRFWWIGPFSLRQVVAAPTRLFTMTLANTASGLALSAIGHALVAEGWRPSDPLAVFGNLFVYRAPLEWYLPGSPLLDAARPRAGACRTVFVVAERALPRDLLGRVMRRTSGRGYVVARL